MFWLVKSLLFSMLMNHLTCKETRDVFVCFCIHTTFFKVLQLMFKTVQISETLLILAFGSANHQVRPSWLISMVGIH